MALVPMLARDLLQALDKSAKRSFAPPFSAHVVGNKKLNTEIDVVGILSAKVGSSTDN